MSLEEAPWILSLFVAGGVSLVGTLIVRSLARRYGWVAPVRKDRWHKSPTALHGGVAIYLAFLAGYLAHRPAWVPGDAILVLCSSAVFLVGLIDDIYHLKPTTKLIGQILAAAALTTFKLRLSWTGNAVVDTSLTIFWLVGISNAVNLLDNMDGLAGGIALIACGFLVAMLHGSGQIGEACLAASLAGAVLGFLLFNFHPASIFMGDSGSLFLGFFLGGVTLLDKGQGTRKALGVVAIPVLLLLIPIMDTTLVTISRKLHRKPVTEGGKDHTSHRLVALGLSEKSAAIALWGLALAAGFMALLVRELRWHIALVLLVGFGLTMVLLGVFLGRVRVYEPASGSPERTRDKDTTLLPTLVGIFRRGRVFEVLNDIILIPAAYFGAFLLRWDGVLIQPYYDNFLKSLPLIIVVQLASFLAVGLYRGVWRYTAIEDLLLFLKAVFVASASSVLTVLLVFRFEDFSRAVFILDALLLLFFLAGSRLSFRLLSGMLRSKGAPKGRRTAIYGAGDAGEILFRELTSNDRLGLRPVIFLDDDPVKVGKTLKGLPIRNGIDKQVGVSSPKKGKVPLRKLRESLEKEDIDEIIISTRQLSKESREELEALCEELGIRCRQMKLDIV